MERIFYATCPSCNARWMVDWELRKSKHDLVCYKCQHTFPTDDAAEIDDRDRP